MTQGALAQHIRPLLQSCNTAPKRRLLPFKTACHIRVVRMTRFYPPEARRPVTIVVVAYEDRGDSPFTDEVSGG